MSENAALPPIEARNFRRIGRGTLVGSADLYVRKWRFWFYGALWHRKGDREWISFPAREWVDRDGERNFFALGKFETHGDAVRFSAAAIAAIKQLTWGAT